MAVLRVIIILSLLNVISPPAANGEITEYQVKAAFLYNLAKFVQWPESLFHTPASPITICVLGRDPFGTALTDTVGGKLLGRRAIAVESINDTQKARHCHIIFVSSSERNRFPAILHDLKTNSALVVGDTEGFAAQGGVVNLKVEADMVRMEINLDAVREKNLQISSKVLSLAQIVRYTGLP